MATAVPCLDTRSQASDRISTVDRCSRWTASAWDIGLKSNRADSVEVTVAACTTSVQSAVSANSRRSQRGPDRGGLARPAGCGSSPTATRGSSVEEVYACEPDLGGETLDGRGRGLEHEGAPELFGPAAQAEEQTD